eukprot:1135745-Karenia_brevis.AAC.1
MASDGGVHDLQPFLELDDSALFLLTYAKRAYCIQRMLLKCVYCGSSSVYHVIRNRDGQVQAQRAAKRH